MSILNKKEALVLGIGDVLLFLLALLSMLLFRYGGALNRQIFYAHLAPFSLLFVAWLMVFFIAGLYEKHTLLLRSRLPSILLKAVLANAFIAVIFFYFVPSFGIAPKINLFLYLAISFTFILFWRMYGYLFFYAKKKQNAILIGTGEELAELASEVNQNERYSIRFVASVEILNLNLEDFKKSVLRLIETEAVSLVALDLQNSKLESVLPYLYDLVFQNVRFIDIHRLYEEIFDRIPLSLVKYNWFLEHVSVSLSGGYDALKRMMDVSFSFVLGALSLILYPFIIAAIKLDDDGSIFIFQERVGAGERVFRTIKFRTMTRDDEGHPEAQKENKPTRVGPWLRRSRLDELPQFWNVLKGALSLIGPRPELPSLVAVYEKEVAYYTIRHLIKPGLSGWAQLYQKNPPKVNANVGETKKKLSYDLYYLKNRSFFLDLKIALKTVKTLLSRSGA